MDRILKLENIVKKYQKGTTEVTALGGVSLEIGKGEFLSIMGPSGSGKTTLLNIVGCLDSATSGRVLYDGKDLSGMREEHLSEYRKRNIGFIFQSYNLVPVLTVRENVELPMVIERKWTKTEMADRAMKILETVGLGDKANRLPKELSGGQEQRVAIARALVKDPIVVLADEPTANLDSATAEDIIELMRKVNAEKQTTFIFSTHDPRVENHARRIIVLKDGQVASDERR